MHEHGANTALLVTLGGDGTFLYGARLAAPLGIPVVGVNRGRLGLPQRCRDRRAARGDQPVCRRRFHDAAAVRCLRSPSSGAAEPVLAINEIVVRARDVNVVRLRVEVDGDLLGAFDADGVVVATATGSTAYALSAGGPPVDPRVRAVVVVPIAAHAVISRPVVIPEQLDVRVTVDARPRLRRSRRTLDRVARGWRAACSSGRDPSSKSFASRTRRRFNSRLRQKFRYGIPHKDLLLEPVDDDVPGDRGGTSGAS